MQSSTGSGAGFGRTGGLVSSPAGVELSAARSPERVPAALDYDVASHLTLTGMRISEIAAAAGTTPRAVRHYHRLGLLPEPVRPDNGYRDYGMAELTRLMRIRWLADNGLPLGAVAAVFANEHGASDTEGRGRG